MIEKPGSLSYALRNASCITCHLLKLVHRIQIIQVSKDFEVSKSKI
jgi:hypothetical protein